ncbi:MAG TPA: hypothetical protein VFH61_08725 [Thermoleophilia bacterium]|nr:hypothetical protein [Thermoleophilia bacterium]
MSFALPGLVLAALLLTAFVAWLSFRHATTTQQRFEGLVRDLLNRQQARTAADLERLSKLPMPSVDAQEARKPSTPDQRVVGPTPSHPRLAQAGPNNWSYSPATGRYRIFSGGPGDRTVEERTPDELDDEDTIVDSPSALAASLSYDED